MKISELIFALEQIKDAHGDLDVETTAFDGRRMSISTPRIDHRAILKGRESKPRFASYYFDAEAQQRIGDKVCRL